ncbi:unnamed protein product [Anisakis simplex]|uniref:WD_REPEATS_REGION domain-containing protein n=1 Tax=Anisakis simplex TaxID=6269 RepID=A0A0M3JRW2_ANISI|nr:unnamed protein product [Anisakis simplex]
MPNNREFIELPVNIQEHATNLKVQNARTRDNHQSFVADCSSNDQCLRSDVVLIAMDQNDSTPASFEAATNKSINNNNRNNAENNNTNNSNGNDNSNKNRHRRLKPSAYRTFVRLLRKQFLSLATSTPDQHDHSHDHNLNTSTTINSCVASPSSQITTSNGFCSSQHLRRHHQSTTVASEVIEPNDSTNSCQKSCKETLFPKNICHQDTHLKIGGSTDCQSSLLVVSSEIAMATKSNNRSCVPMASEHCSSGQGCSEKRSPFAVGVSSYCRSLALSSSSQQKCDIACERQYDSNKDEANNSVQQRFNKEKDHQLQTITATSNDKFDEATTSSSRSSSTLSQAERASREQQQAACTSAELQSTSASISDRRVHVTVKAAAKLVQQLLPAAVYDDPFCAVTVDGLLHISEYYLMSNNRSKRRLSNYDRSSSKSIHLFDILTVFYANWSSLTSQNTESSTSLLYRAWGLTPINSVWWAADSTRTAGNRRADVSKMSSSLVVLRCVKRHPLQHGFTVVNLNAFINALRACGLPESCSFVAHLPSAASNDQFNDEQVLKYMDDVVVDVDKTQQLGQNSTDEIRKLHEFHAPA